MGQVGEVLVSLLAPPLIAGLIGFVALGIGAYLVGPFVKGERPPLVESFALGTLAISLLTLLWGLLGWMGIYARWSLALPLILVGILGWIQVRPGWPLVSASFRNRTILVLSLLLAVGVLLRIALSPLYPPVALEECRSNLPAALGIVETGRMAFHPDIAFNSFPQNAEMLYSWAIAYAPLTAAHYLNFMAFVFCILAMIRLGRVVFSVKTGWLAALIMASIGSLQVFGSNASPFMWVLLYTLTSVLVLVKGLKEGSTGRVLLAGIFLGAAAGVDYTSLMASLTLAISLFAIGGKIPGSGRIPRWSIAAAVGLFIVVALPWYLRNVFWFHNPVFPFYESMFRPGGGIYGVYGPESTVRTGWILGSETASVFYQRGVLWPKVLAMWPAWIVVPAGIWFLRANPFMRVAMAWTLLVWAFWMIGGGGIMYFPYYICLVPVNVLALAHLLGILYSLPPGDHRGRFFRIVLWTLLIGWIGIGGASTSRWFPPLTSEQRDRTLSRLQGSFDLMKAADKAIAENRVAVGILCQDGRLYADFILLGGGDVGWANHRMISDSCTSPRALADLLRERYSADYLVVHEQRLREQNTAFFVPIKGLLRSAEFPMFFREVDRVGEGAVYRISYPEQFINPEEPPPQGP